MSEIRALVQAGQAAQQHDHAAEERGKLGTLRGGNCGAVLSDGWYGKCGRLSWLRALGHQEPVDANSLNMFAFGYATEDITARELRAAGLTLSPPLTLSYALPDGTQVSTRPDLVITTDGLPTHLIECKMVASLWTARAVHYDLRPKSDHLIQAAHQWLQLTGDIPATGGRTNPKCSATILYRSGAEFHLSTAPAFLRDRFVPGTHDVEFKPDGSPLKIRPFIRGYALGWTSDGRLTYHTDGLPAPVETRLTHAAIYEYYTNVAQLIAGEGPLPPRPTATSIDGSKSYKACDYCSLKATCDAYERTDIHQWRDQAQLVLQTMHEGTK